MIWRHATIDDAERVRVLRNAGRDWFHSTLPIGVEGQLSWWASASSSPDFFCIVTGEPPIGYGMILRREDRLWISLAVDPLQRGSGIGTQIYGTLPGLVDEPLFAAIRRDNLASRRAAEKAGYVPGDAKPPGVASVEDWVVLCSPSR